jgi:WD40 repeat protein
VTATANAAGASGLTSVAFSPDGAEFAAAGFDGTVRLWDARVAGKTPTQLGNFSGHRFPIEHIAFSPDGTLLAASAVGDTTMQVWWSASRLTRVASFSDTQQTPYPPQLGGGVFMLAFSPDGRSLALGNSDGNVYLYSVPATYTRLKDQIKLRGEFSASSKSGVPVR